MTYYNMTSEPYQSFSFPVNGVSVQMTVRYMPTINSWIADLEGVVEGIRLSPFIPLFKAYGYPEIFFAIIPGVEFTDDLSQVLIVVADADEIADNPDPYLRITNTGEVVLT